MSNNFYSEFKTFPVAKVKEITSPTIAESEWYLVEYITTSVMHWTIGQSKELYCELSSAVKDRIEIAMSKGYDVYIQKNWRDYSNEVLLNQISINNKTSLNNYVRRATSFIKSYINPQMSQVHASVIYGFTTLNNKFLEKGFVFSEDTRQLKYIDIMERASELEEEALSEDDPKIEEADKLMQDLEKYIEYRDILQRSYFAYDLTEHYIKRIEDKAKEQNPILKKHFISIEEEEDIYNITFINPNFTPSYEEIKNELQESNESNMSNEPDIQDSENNIESQETEENIVIDSSQDDEVDTILSEIDIVDHYKNTKDKELCLRLSKTSFDLDKTIGNKLDLINSEHSNNDKDQLLTYIMEVINTVIEYDIQYEIDLIVQEFTTKIEHLNSLK